MIEIKSPQFRICYGGEATVIFPMEPEAAMDAAQLLRTLVADCVLDRGFYVAEDDCYACASHGDVHISAGWIESVYYSDVPEYGLRLDLTSWEPGDLDYTQAPTELSLDARLAAAAAVRVILAAIDC